MSRKNFSPLRWIVLALAAGLISVPAVAQDGEGRGVVLYLDESTTPAEGVEAFYCRDTTCARVLSFLYPMLFSFDPLTSQAVGGETLVLDPPALPDAEQTYTLKDGLTWSDGEPITAYDVAYSLLARDPLVNSPASPLTGLRIDDETHLTLGFDDPDCVTQTRINSMVIPSHVFNPDFRAFADSFAAQADDELPSPRSWRDAYREQTQDGPWQQPLPSNTRSLTTGNRFELKFDEGRDLVYLKQGDLVVNNDQGDLSALQHFLRGDANVLLDPPFDQRADLKATPGLQLYEAPGYAVDYLVFNQSDPNYPRDAFIDGEPLEQLPHPYFSDVRVRRAIQLAIDVPALIDGALYGGGVPLNGAYAPVSWAYDPDAPLPVYDPEEAKRLLDEAGWRDIDGDGYRDCFGCQNARPGTVLDVYLQVDGDAVRSQVSDMLRTQLARIGVALYSGGDGDSDGSEQYFDLLLTGTTARDPDLYRMFAREWDRLGLAEGNIGSVDDPALEAALDEARRVPGCAVDARAEKYREAQAILREDVPAIWLYARNDLYAARGIVGFAPLPGDPFWNISDWVAVR